MESVNFDRAAGYYDATRALPAGSMDAPTRVLAGELADRQPCLEIGTGTGRIALPLCDQGIRLLAVNVLHLIPHWRVAVDEALRRNGLVRTAIGARDPDQVAGYLGSRATARENVPLGAGHEVEPDIRRWAFELTG